MWKVNDLEYSKSNQVEIGWSQGINSRKYRNLIIWTTQKQKMLGFDTTRSGKMSLQVVIGMQIELPDGGENLVN